MIRYAATLAIALATTGAQAADTAQRRASAASTPATYDDTEGLALRGGVASFIATRDTDKFERNITRVGTMVHYESSYDFTAIGASTNLFRQGGWSTRVNSLEAVIRNVNRATAAGINARVALAAKSDRTELHGEGSWNIRFSERTGAELVASRDAVESQQVLKNGTMASFIGVSLDHALTDRLTVIGMPTYRRFTDGNEQVGLRGWLIYTLMPEYGLSVNLKARGYESSQNGGGAYFSPDRYERAEIGLRLRRAFGDWRVFATADVGKERINGDVEKPTRELGLTALRSFANDVTLGFQFAYYRASDSASNSGTADQYAWRWARAVAVIPF